MFRLASIMLLMSTVSCATDNRSSTGSASWCFEEHEQGSREKITDFEVDYVRHDRVSSLVNALRNKTLIPLSREEAETLVGRRYTGLGGNFYVVRSSVTTAPQATLKDSISLARSDVIHSAFWSSEDYSIAIFVSQSVPGDRQATNLPVVFRTKLYVSRAYLGCFVTD